MKSNDESEIIFSVKKNKPKENPISYNLETMQDIYDALTVDNIDSFLPEFEIIIRSVILAKRMNNDKPMKFGKIVWTDD